LEGGKELCVPKSSKSSTKSLGSYLKEVDILEHSGVHSWGGNKRYPEGSVVLYTRPVMEGRVDINRTLPELSSEMGSEMGFGGEGRKSRSEDSIKRGNNISVKSFNLRRTSLIIQSV